jgi:hypothetical protein
MWLHNHDNKDGFFFPHPPNGFRIFHNASQARQRGFAENSNRYLHGFQVVGLGLNSWHKPKHAFGCEGMCAHNCTSDFISEIIIRFLFWKTIGGNQILSSVWQNSWIDCILFLTFSHGLVYFFSIFNWNKSSLACQERKEKCSSNPLVEICFKVMHFLFFCSSILNYDV